MTALTPAGAVVPTEGGAFCDLVAGTRVVDRYTVREKIADGAHATVYVADDEVDGTPVALKILDPLRGTDPVGRLRFEREFAILRRLSHPSIAACHRLESDGALDVLVLELIEGETLAARLARGRLGIAEAGHIALRLADALDTCHQQGVLHRDLKPANIILHPERGPVVLDFGVAWFSTALNLTRTGAVVGSPQYLAPEVFASSISDERADVYALGAVLFEMLTGRPVHLAESVAELAIVHLDEAAPSAAAIRPGIDRHLDAVVAKAIAPRPEDRFATARELHDALARRRVIAGASLRARLPCDACGTPLIINLALCPGCGANVDWQLSDGPYAVQLNAIESVPRATRWLRERFADAFRTTSRWTERRLSFSPVPLMVGASASTAERLAAEAGDAGCAAEIVRARALTGARVRAAAASTGEILVAAGLHLTAVLLTAWIAALLGAEPLVLATLPTVFGVIGLAIAMVYVRRAVLVARPRAEAADRTEALAGIKAQLSALKQPRGRRLAAAAVSRAAPVLLDDVAGLASAARIDVAEQLDRALAAAAQVDVHTALLLARPRAQLATEIEASRSRIEAGDASAGDELRRLEGERDDLTEASLAHDLGAREALAACEAISRALATRG